MKQKTRKQTRERRLKVVERTEMLLASSYGILDRVLIRASPIIPTIEMNYLCTTWLRQDIILAQCFSTRGRRPPRSFGGGVLSL